jgi:transcriptional regulator with XRE-family HTH domain
MESEMVLDAKKIRSLRESCGWSQEQLAEAAGVSVRTVQRAEKDGSASRETKVCLAAALNVPHDQLAASHHDPEGPARPTAILNVSAQTRAQFHRAELHGLGGVIGSFIGLSVANGMTVQTLLRAMFIGAFVYAVFAVLRELMRPRPETQ